MYRSDVRAPVHRSTACRDWLGARVVLVSVASASVLRVVVPAIAVSTNDVNELLTVSPHVPDNSPDTGRAKPKSDVAAVVMGLPYVVLILYRCQVFLGTVLGVGVCRDPKDENWAS